MSSTGSPLKPSTVTPAPGLRLDSWKEIAAYLKRSPRTVSRWEREEGLPALRHLHHKKETVYAFTDRIDAWLKSRGKTGGTGLGPGPLTSAPPPELAEISKREALSPRPLLIAVLPLRNLTDNSAKGVFADALTDEVISELGQLCPERLRVIAFTSAAHYRHSGKSIQQIGKELRVDYVMEGGVRWYGRRVRVTARLIAVRDQAQIWADSFEIQLPPFFALQQGLARELAGALSAKLGLPVTRTPPPETACNPAAHSAYLLGTQLFQWSEPDIKKGLDLFSRAIEKDPNCAPAYAELAMAWFRLGFLYDYPPAATIRGEQGTCPEELGIGSGAVPWPCRNGTIGTCSAPGTGRKPRPASRRAVELNPSDERARIVLAACHLVLNRPDKAVEEMRQASRLDPLSPVLGASLVILGFFARSYDMAIRGCQKLLSHDASSALAHLMMGACFATKGDYARALTHCEKARVLGKGQIIYTATLCSVCAGAGRRSSAERLLQELVTMTKQQYVRYIFLAQAAVNLGNKDHTLEWLEKAYEQHDALLVFLKADPRFELLSRSARFRNLLGRIGLTN